MIEAGVAEWFTSVKAGSGAFMDGADADALRRGPDQLLGAAAAQFLRHGVEVVHLPGCGGCLVGAGEL